MARYLSQELCLRLLTTVINDSQTSLNLPAVKMQTQVIKVSSPELVQDVLPDLIPGLIAVGSSHWLVGSMSNSVLNHCNLFLGVQSWGQSYAQSEHLLSCADCNQIRRRCLGLSQWPQCQQGKRFPASPSSFLQTRSSGAPSSTLEFLVPRASWIYQRVFKCTPYVPWDMIKGTSIDVIGFVHRVGKCVHFIFYPDPVKKKQTFLVIVADNPIAQML